MVELDGVHYATMVAVGFHRRRGLLVMTNAGHPPAFWYRANRGEWGWFEPRRALTRPGVSGTPLGLLANASYDRIIVKPEPDDLIVLYSDGVSEATNPAGTELGRDDLMTLARTLDTVRPKRSARSSLRPSRRFVEDRRQRTMRPSSCCKGLQINRPIGIKTLLGPPPKAVSVYTKIHRTEPRCAVTLISDGLLDPGGSRRGRVCALTHGCVPHFRVALLRRHRARYVSTDVDTRQRADSPASTDRGLFRRRHI